LVFAKAIEPQNPTIEIRVSLSIVKTSPRSERIRKILYSNDFIIGKTEQSLFPMFGTSSI